MTKRNQLRKINTSKVVLSLFSVTECVLSVLEDLYELVIGTFEFDTHKTMMEAEKNLLLHIYISKNFMKQNQGTSILVVKKS